MPLGGHCRFFFSFLSAFGPPFLPLQCFHFFLAFPFCCFTSTRVRRCRHRVYSWFEAKDVAKFILKLEGFLTLSCRSFVFFNLNKPFFKLLPLVGTLHSCWVLALLRHFCGNCFPYALVFEVYICEIQFMHLIQCDQQFYALVRPPHKMIFICG